MRQAKIPPEMASLLEGYQDPAILLDRQYGIVAANRAYVDCFGEADVIGRRCYEVSHHNSVPCDQAGEDCPLQGCRESGTPQRVLHIHHSPRGEEHVEVETRPLADSQGNVRFFLEILRPTAIASAGPAKEGMVGRSPAFNRMIELVQRVAPSEAVALLLGESGTGKELVARAIHEQSPRRKGGFVPVECSGLTESLFESELFGHEKGAFTGALGRREGLVEAARGGTLFLDEVGDIPLQLQVKLLRLLETRTFRRVGSVEPLQADFRLVCATHRELRQMVAEGSFREDLYYRISVFPVQLPALRERIADLPTLADSLLARVGGKQSLHLSREALHCLMQYPFPGNIRELRNILERATLMVDGDTILPRHLPDICVPGAQAISVDLCSGQEVIPLALLEQRYLQRVLTKHGGDKRELARQLGVSERTLFRKLQRMRQDSGAPDSG